MKHSISDKENQDPNVQEDAQLHLDKAIDTTKTFRNPVIDKRTIEGDKRDDNVETKSDAEDDDIFGENSDHDDDHDLGDGDSEDEKRAETSNGNVREGASEVENETKSDAEDDISRDGKWPGWPG